MAPEVCHDLLGNRSDENVCMWPPMINGYNYDLGSPMFLSNGSGPDYPQHLLGVASFEGPNTSVLINLTHHREWLTSRGALGSSVHINGHEDCKNIRHDEL